MSINKKIILCFGFLLFIPATIFASKEIETVQIINATYCHLRPGNSHWLGQATYLASFTAEGREFSFIPPGETRDVPLIKKNGRQYIVLDYAMAAD
jgi:hypothetical protein